ncbi:3-hydroxyacyl-CoA dehydrogenase NAD-binding domain-containing protein [Streptomyces sp. NBC_00893]|uniref:3-hydroxyacyl-CoA dehydrogenase NAD-binding domain-containing protein n=1 Tax=Streptomyces sp. NBC_00893 TaxID=2975862 RepID=UPI002B1E34F7|nr:3-hydroxyacyl-CoA dehydrogenase NAD-binding domain-containing protein [Streptomyces sp. NBC_00893]
MTETERLGVVLLGAGRMGQGIALAFLTAGMDVTLADVKRCRVRRWGLRRCRSGCRGASRRRCSELGVCRSHRSGAVRSDGSGCRVRCDHRSSRPGWARGNSWGREDRQRCGSVLGDACRSRCRPRRSQGR